MWVGSEEGWPRGKKKGQQRRKMDGMGKLEIRNLGLLFSGGDGEEVKRGGTHPSAATRIWAPR